jgi:hypothetical protein
MGVQIGGFICLRLRAFGFDLHLPGAVPVLPCHVAGGQENPNHSLATLLQPRTDRQVLSAAVVPSLGEPSRLL